MRLALLATLACVSAAVCWAAGAVLAAGAFDHGVTPERLAETRVVVALAPLAPLATILLIARRDLLRPPRGGRRSARRAAVEAPLFRGDAGRVRTMTEQFASNRCLEG